MVSSYGGASVIQLTTKNMATGAPMDTLATLPDKTGPTSPRAADGATPRGAAR